VLGQRLAVAARPSTWSLLLQTTLAMAAGFSVLTYICPVLSRAGGYHGAMVSDTPGRMSRAEVAVLVHRTASVTAELRDADLIDKAALYKGLNLRLTYEHLTGTIWAEAQLNGCPFWDKVRVRGGT
jgi:hypothetical protein